MNCPFCQKDIEDDSTWCRHCGKALDDGKTKKEKWYFRPGSLLIGFLLVGPLILPGIWFHPRMKNSTKIILTVLVLLVTLALAKYTAEALKVIASYYGAVGI